MKIKVMALSSYIFEIEMASVQGWHANLWSSL